MIGRSELADEAAAWVVRLSGDEAGEGDWLAFLAWLDAGADGEADLRRAAFDKAQATWLALDGLRDGEVDRRATERGRGRRRAFAGRSGAWAALAAAAALVASLGVWTLSRPRLAPPPAAVRPASTAYLTAAGQSRTIRLADGSRIDMDGATALSVGLGAGARRVVLRRGEASFEVVHDPRRPFTVDLGPAQVTVLGTAFDIERQDGRVRVAVARGAVSLRTDRQLLRLPAGTLAQLAPDGSLSVGRTPAAEVADWRNGRRLYMDASLPRIVADLNRRYPRPIRIAGDRAAHLRFTGVLVLGPQARTVRRLTGLLPLDASQGDHGEIVLSSRRP